MATKLKALGVAWITMSVENGKARRLVPDGLACARSLNRSNWSVFVFVAREKERDENNLQIGRLAATTGTGRD